MTLPRTKAGGWGVLEKFTSAQANSLDINITNALDKSTAGDELLGVVTMSSAAAILVNSPGAAIISSVQQGLTTNGIPSGITSGGIGGIALTGGSPDYPTFMNSAGSAPAPRSFTRVVPLAALNVVGGGFTTGLTTPAAIGNAIASGQYFVLPSLWTGATLASVSVNFSVLNAHSAVPAALPSMGVIRRTVTAGLAVVQNLSTSAFQTIPAPGSGAAYTASGDDQLLTYVTNQNNVIDNSHMYYVNLFDENGANSIAGNLYFSFILQYTAVADMRPQ